MAPQAPVLALAASLLFVALTPPALAIRPLAAPVVDAEEDSCTALYQVLQKNLQEFNSTYPSQYGYVDFIFARPSQVLPCTQSVEFNATRDLGTLTSVIDYFTNFYSLIHVAEKSPEPRLPSEYNVVGELQKVGQAAWNTSEDFYSAVIKAIARLDDGHTRFENNCPPFAHKLANPLVGVVEDGVPTVRLAPASFLSDLFVNISLVPFNYNPLDYAGAKVVLIEGENAWKYMTKWAADNAGAYHTEGQKVNYAFSHVTNDQLQPVSDGKFGLLLENPRKDFLSVTIVRNGGEAETLEIPYIAYTPEYLIDGFANSSTYYSSFCAVQYFYPNSPATGSQAQGAGEPGAKREDAKFSPKLTVFDAPETPAEGAKVGPDAFLAKPTVSMMIDIPKALKERESGVPPLPQTGGTLISNPFDLWQVYLLSDNQTAVVVLDTFAPELPYQGGALEYFVLRTLRAFYLANKYSTRIILDLTSNLGGFVSFVPWLIELIVGSEVYPVPPSQKGNPWNMLAETDVVRLMRAKNLYPYVYYAYGDVNNVPFTDATKDKFFYPIGELTFGKNGIPGNYSNFFKEGSPPLSQTFYPFPPAFGDKPYILYSNGLCFSACSEFAVTLNQRFGVPLVGIGGLPGEQMPFSAGGGGFVSLNMENDFYYSFDAEVRALPDCPKQFQVVSNLAMRIVNGYFQEPTTVNVSAPIEFTYVPAGVKIDYTLANVADVTLQYLEAAQAYWGK